MQDGSAPASTTERQISGTSSIVTVLGAISRKAALLLLVVVLLCGADAVHGGSIAAADPLEGLRIEPEAMRETYNRDDWPNWIDEDSDGQSAREEVLIAESLVPVTMNSFGKVIQGLWVDPYTGFVTRNPGDLDIDHMVPLAEAHVSGGYAWSAEWRMAFANDLQDAQHLIAVWNSANRSKSDRDPGHWMPPNRAYWCSYLNDWIAIKRRWDLAMDENEAAHTRKGLAVCERYEKGDRLWK